MITDKLKQLKELDAHLDVIKMEKKAAIDSVVTPEIKAELNAIDAEFDETSASIAETVAVLTEEIKTLVLEDGFSTKKGNDHYGATFVKGRVFWNTNALDGYAAAHPEIDRFRKPGEPSVRINKKA